MSKQMRKPPFEFVKLRLQGAVKTQTATKVSIEKFLSLVEECPWSQFTPEAATDDYTSQSHSAKVVFDGADKPMSIASSLPNRPLPPTSISASTYVTEHTALHDQHLVQGRCETHCWVTAEFYSEGVVTHRCQAIVEPEHTTALLSLRPTKSNQSGQASTTCHQANRPFDRFRKSTRQQASARVCLPEGSLVVVPSQTPDDKHASSVSIPLKVSLDGLPAAELAGLDQSGMLACDVETAWVSQKNFNTGPSDGQRQNCTTFSKRTVSTQMSTIIFPPVYRSESRTATNDVSTTGILQLILPESASLPTMSSELLRVDYRLEIRLLFRLSCGTRIQGKLHTACILDGW